jgi:hypothetical protein
LIFQQLWRQRALTIGLLGLSLGLGSAIGWLLVRRVSPAFGPEAVQTWIKERVEDALVPLRPRIPDFLGRDPRPTALALEPPLTPPAVGAGGAHQPRKATQTPRPPNPAQVRLPRPSKTPRPARGKGAPARTPLPTGLRPLPPPETTVPLTQPPLPTKTPVSQVIPPPQITVGHVVTSVGKDLLNTWMWTVFIQGTDAVLDQVKCVEYILPPTFPNPRRVVCERGTGPTAFPLSLRGSGTVEIQIRVHMGDGHIYPLRLTLAER